MICNHLILRPLILLMGLIWCTQLLTANTQNMHTFQADPIKQRGSNDSYTFYDNGSLRINARINSGTAIGNRSDFIHPDLMSPLEKQAYFLWQADQKQLEAERIEQEDRAYRDYLARQERIRHQVHLEGIRKVAEPAAITEIAKSPQLLESTRQLQSSLSANDFEYQLLDKRFEALKKLKKDDPDWREQSYSFSVDGCKLMYACKTDTSKFTKFFGNTIQRVVHEEIVSIIGEAGRLYASDATATLQISTYVVNASEAARLLNRTGKWADAFQVNSLSLVLLNPKLSHQATGQLATTMFNVQKQEPAIKAQWYIAQESLERAGPEEFFPGQIVETAKTYAQLFQKTDIEFHLEVVHVLADTCTDRLSHLPGSELYTILNDHHESICMEAIRHLAANGANSNKLNQVAKQLLNIPTGNNQQTEKIITRFFDDNLQRRIGSFSKSKYRSLEPAFFTPQGIPKEYSLSYKLNQLPASLYAQLDTAKSTNLLLNEYQYAQNNFQKETAQQGLIYLKQAVASQDKRVAASYKNLAMEHHHKAHANNKIAQSKWQAYLTVLYDDPAQQAVQDLCTWFTEQLLKAQKTVDDKDIMSKRLLSYIEDQLEYVFRENANRQPENALELFNDILETFIGCKSIDLVYQQYPLFNFKDRVENLANQSKNFTNLIYRNVRFDSIIEEQLGLVARDCARFYIQSGHIIRDFDQLTQEEQQAQKRRTPPEFNRKGDYKALLVNWATRHFHEINPYVYEKFKNHFSPNEFALEIRKCAIDYAQTAIKSGHTWPAIQLDSITAPLNPNAVALPMANLFGFILEPQHNAHQDKDFVTVKHADPQGLAIFQETWPDEITLEEELDLWQDELELWPEHAQEAACARYEAREAAYEKTSRNPNVFTKQRYELSDNVEALLSEYDIDSELFTHGIYNPLQHQLHIELVDIIEQTTNMIQHWAYTSEYAPSTKYVINMATIGAKFNKIGDIIATATVADFCWGLVDCGHAVLEGMYTGGREVVIYALNNKTEALMYGLFPTVMSKYYLAKFAFNVSMLAADYAHAA